LSFRYIANPFFYLIINVVAASEKTPRANEVLADLRPTFRRFIRLYALLTQIQVISNQFCRHFIILSTTRLRSDGNLRRRSSFPYYIPYFQVGTGGRKPTRKNFRNRAALFGKLAANRAFRRRYEEKTIRKIERQPI
jgi:hypothetical protein